MSVNWHAAVVHFPIALATVAPLVDLVGQAIRRPAIAWTGVTLFGTAVVASLVATATGQAAYDAAYAAGVSVERLDTHGGLAGVVPWVLLIALAARLWLPTRSARFGAPLGLALGLLCAPLVVWVGATGGTLVYTHGVGVQAPEGR